MLACVGLAMSLSLLTIAFSQNADPDVTMERRIRQLDNEILNLQRQVFDAARVVNQAQSEAQMAQSIARDAANRIR